MPMSDPRELEWAKKPDALKEGWTARTGTHMVHGVSPYRRGLPVPLFGLNLRFVASTMFRTSDVLPLSSSASAD
jgi:hypothetical protein